VKAVRQVSALDKDDLVKSVRWVHEKISARRYFMAPTSEALNRFMLAERHEFEAMGCVVPLVNEATYKLISDKYQFSRHCGERGIRVPRELSEVRAFPIVAKPREYWSVSRNTALYPSIINSEADYLRFSENNDRGEFFFQEFVGGKSYYLLYCFRREAEPVMFSQENLIQQPGGKSVVAAIPSHIHQEPVAAEFVSVFSALKYFGLVMVEVKFYNGEYFMIEANPRLWGPSQLFVDAGCPLFQAYLSDYGIPAEGGGKSAICDDGTVRYFWFGGLLEALSSEKRLTYHNYNYESFVRQLPDWLAADVHKRPDSINIFLDEVNALPCYGQGNQVS
jgi:predicted ATP-grasp superfamily ATP-dependent carboligase